VIDALREDGRAAEAAAFERALALSAAIWRRNR
jgi:hypothetical protein